MMEWLGVVFGAGLLVVVFSLIFSKAGYSRWLGIIIVVPIVNVIWLILFALIEWPIERRLKCGSNWDEIRGRSDYVDL